MNVLILTPDRVGSTLLQRLITIYMLRKEFDQAVINLHELSNGLIKYYNEKLNQEVLGKPEGTEWGYYQSLPEIVELLKSVDHYKTSRLAHYHLINRKDSIHDQIPFYEYLNKNFYIISCRRGNLFEHALSWMIQAHSKKLNVYTLTEKVAHFKDIYKNGITVSKEGLEKYLDQYVDYISWVDTYFNVQSYFDYEKNMANIEEYILNLDFMKGHDNNTWQDMFGQSFEVWNTCHRMLPNLLLHDRPQNTSTQQMSLLTNSIGNQHWNAIKGKDWPESWTRFETSKLLPDIKKEIENMLQPVQVSVTTEEYAYLQKNLPGYRNTQHQLEQLQRDGFMVSPVPLKLQSLLEKKQIINNFSQCVEWYNQWVNRKGVGKLYSEQELETMAVQEEQRLVAPMTQQLENVTNKLLSS